MGPGYVDRASHRNAQEVGAGRKKRGLDRRGARRAFAQRGDRKGESDRDQVKRRDVRGAHRARTALGMATAAGDSVGKGGFPRKEPRASQFASKKTGLIGEGPRLEQPLPAKTPWARAVSHARSRAPAIYRETKRPSLRIFASAEVGEMRRIGFTEIREVECRWPLGDPTQEDFVYCGLQVAKGRAYCAGHCRLAYRSS